MNASTELRIVLITGLVFAVVACGGSSSNGNDGDNGDNGDGDVAEEVPLMDSVPDLAMEQMLFSIGDNPGEPTDSTNGHLPAEPPRPPAGSADDGQPQEMGAIGVEFVPERLRSDVREFPDEHVEPKYDWRELRFSSGVFTPDPGLGQHMQRRISTLHAGDRERVYGFVIMEEYMSPQRRSELVDDHNLEFLGDHSGAQKVAIPLDEANALADRDFVHWVGFSQTDQKFSHELQRLRDESETLPSGDVPSEIPLFVNLFDHDTEDERFRNEIESTGAQVGDFDDDLLAYRVAASWDALERIADLDFVLFMEPILEREFELDESTPTVGTDYIRPGLSGSGYDGSGVTFGIVDAGFMVGSAAHNDPDATMHVDLNKWGCGITASTWTQDSTPRVDGHGTHVLGIAAGSGTADSRYTGVAPGVGTSESNRFRAAGVFGNADSSTVDGFEFMAHANRCGESSLRPHVVNYSGGDSGTTTRKSDEIAWNHRQLFVKSAGNNGPWDNSITSPGKNVMAVGNVRYRHFERVGQINPGSSRGLTDDDRMKPNVVAPGTDVNSARVGTADEYWSMSGTSMAAPHVSGLALTMMEHYESFQWRPMLARARLMSTAILHDDDTTLSDGATYGFGRISSYKAHWRRDNPEGWRGHWSWGRVHHNNFRYRDITVPEDARRLVVVMTWDEPAASAGADSARIWDLELWLDHEATCGETPRCGNHWDYSWDDNTISVIVDRPQAGTWRLKSVPYVAPPSFLYSLPVGIAAVTIMGDTEHQMDMAVEAPSEVQPGETFTVTTSVTSPSYITSGVHLENTGLPFGVNFQRVETTRADGELMEFEPGFRRELTLGNIHESDSRSAEWTFQVGGSGCHELEFRAWSGNGGAVIDTATVCVAD